MPDFFCMELMPCLSEVAIDLLSQDRSPTGNPLMLWGPSKHVCLSAAELSGGEHEVNFPCAAENVRVFSPVANGHLLCCQQSAGWQQLGLL